MHSIIQFFIPFCRSWVAFVSFRKVRRLIVFLPFVNFRIAHSVILDWRERSFVENCFAFDAATFECRCRSHL